MSGAPPVRLRSLSAIDGEAVAAIWNATFAASHPLGPLAWAAWWASPDADPALTWGAEDAHGRLVGVLLARAPVRPWAPAEVGHVALFAVAPTAAGRGVGDLLWRAMSAALRDRGRRRVRLGGDPERWLPGVPAAAPPAAWRFLRARGVRPGGLEADLWLDLRDPAIDAPTLPAGVALVDDDPGVVAWVARAFPGRWADEVERYANAGCAVLALHRDGAVVGFCVAQRPDHAPLGPGLAWTARGPWGLPRPDVAGLGPLGLDPSARGGGLGLALVAAAARWQRDRGHAAVVIDWTTLTDFYGRLGAHVWRVYQRAEGDL